MNLDIYESQKLLLEIATDIFSGDTLNELMKTLQNLVQNHIVSEEFLYLLKSASAISGEGSW